MLRVFTIAQLAGSALAWKCCWSRWGNETTCGGYPAGAHGGLCNTDYTMTCNATTNCSATPPSPPSPVPPSPPIPPPSPTSSGIVYQSAVFDVAVTHDVTYAQGLRCSDQYKASSCNAMDLKLDIYEPKAKSGGAAIQKMKPAYVLMHGGGNAGGSKGGINMNVGKWWASRGFVVFDINYRLSGDKGLLPSQRNSTELQWSPGWSSLYPATRDAKAAIRFVRASTVTYGIDVGRIASSGGSAGATDMLVAGVGFEEDFKDELTITEDPTLASTHTNVSSAVQCLVLHWPSDGGVTLVQQHYPAKGDRYRKANPPVVSFHGDKDTTIPIEHSYALQQAYANTGVPFYMHVLKGCPHASWCYDGMGHCTCSGVKWSPLMEELAFPAMVKSLKLKVVNATATVLI